MIKLKYLLLSFLLLYYFNSSAQTKWSRGSKLDFSGYFNKTFDTSLNNNYRYSDWHWGYENWLNPSKITVTDFNKDGYEDLILFSDMIMSVPGSGTGNGSQGIQFLRFFQNNKLNNFTEVTKNISDLPLSFFGQNYSNFPQYSFQFNILQFSCISKTIYTPQYYLGRRTPK